MPIGYFAKQSQGVKPGYYTLRTDLHNGGMEDLNQGSPDFKIIYSTHDHSLTLLGMACNCVMANTVLFFLSVCAAFYTYMYMYTHKVL